MKKNKPFLNNRYWKVEGDLRKKFRMGYIDWLVEKEPKLWIDLLTSLEYKPLTERFYIKKILLNK